MKNAILVETKIGDFAIAEENGKITNVYLDGLIPIDQCRLKSTAILKEAKKQLIEYVDQKRTFFDLPYHLEGTEFEKKVWMQLCEIPYGKVKSYQEVATEIGNPKATRAVGRANGLNPIPIFIPCHRVIGKNGKLVGFAGGLTLKETLLQLEYKKKI